MLNRSDNLLVSQLKAFCYSNRCEKMHLTIPTLIREVFHWVLFVMDFAIFMSAVSFLMITRYCIARKTRHDATSSTWETPTAAV